MDRPSTILRAINAGSPRLRGEGGLPVAIRPTWDGRSIRQGFLVRFGMPVRDRLEFADGLRVGLIHLVDVPVVRADETKSAAAAR